MINSLNSFLVSDELNSISNLTSAGLSVKQLEISAEALKISKEILKIAENSNGTHILKEILQLQKEILQELKNIKNS